MKCMHLTSVSDLSLFIAQLFHLRQPALPPAHLAAARGGRPTGKGERAGWDQESRERWHQAPYATCGT